MSPSSDICHLGWGWGRCTGYPTDHSYSLRGLWFCSGPTPFPMTLVGLGHMAPLVSEMGGAGLQWGWGVRGVCPGLLGSSWKRSCWGPGQTPRPKRQGGQTAPGAHELEHSPCWGAAEFQGCLTHIGKLEVEGYIVCVSSAFFASHPPPLGGNDILGAWLPLPHVMHPPGAPWTVDTGLILPTHFSPGLFWG